MSNSVSVGRAAAAASLRRPNRRRLVHAFLAALETHLARRWQLHAPWVADGPRIMTDAHDAVDRAAVTIEAVFCADDGMATAQMAREIGSLERLAHQPAVVRMLATGRAAGWLYIVTAGKAANSLRERIAHTGVLPTRHALDVTITIADLLHFAHGLGIAHGAVSTSTMVLDEDGVLLRGFAATTRITSDADVAPRSRDVFTLAGALFEMLTGQHWTVRTRIPELEHDELRLVLHRALGANRDRRYTSAIAFAQALCAIRDHLAGSVGEVSARDGMADDGIGVLPLSDGADRSLRVLHALLDRAEVAEHPPEPDDPLVQSCWGRASAHVPENDARLVALRCRWRLLADRDPVGALSAARHAPDAAAVVPYRARALAALGRAAEARTLAVRAWFDDVALDLAALRSLTVALLLTRAFEMAMLVSDAETAHGVVDPVIAAAGQTSLAGRRTSRLTAAAQTQTLDAIATAIDRRVPWTAELMVDPRWDALRADRRFSALLANAKSAWTSESDVRV